MASSDGCSPPWQAPRGHAMNVRAAPEVTGPDRATSSHRRTPGPGRTSGNRGGSAHQCRELDISPRGLRSGPVLAPLRCRLGGTMLMENTRLILEDRVRLARAIVFSSPTPEHTTAYCRAI